MSDLGIDHVGVPNWSTEGGSPAAVLQHVAQSHGTLFQSISFDSYLSRLESGADIRPAVFEGTGGDLQVGLGLLTLGGEACIQVIGSRPGPELVAVSTFASSRPPRVWCASGNPGTLSYTVGKARIEVDRLWRNLGLTEPFSEVSTTFSVTNRSRSSVRLESIARSCRCLAVECETVEPLGQNESRAVTVRIKTGDKASYRHNVIVRVQDVESETHRDLPFAIFGNQVRVLSAVPGKIDFGRVRRGSPPISRTLRLTSSPHDPFQITSISAADLPISHSVKSPHSDNGAGEQGQTVVELSLDTTTLQPGASESVLRIESTSRYRPVLEVPLFLFVASHVEAVPGLVSFGSVPIDSSKERRIDLISTDGREFVAHVLRAPEDVDAVVSCENETASVRVNVRAHFRKEGYFEQLVALRLASEEWDEEITLRCVALVRGR